MQVTEKVVLAMIGAGCVLAVAVLVTGGTVSDLVALVAAFGFGAVLPSPVIRG